MKSYPAYRNISLDFLDSIPTTWDVARLKHLSSVNFSNVDKHTFEEEIPIRLCNYVDVYKNDFITPDMDFMKASATEAEIKKFILRKSDVLITKDSESWEDIAIPAYVTSDMDGVLCGYHLAQIRSTGIDGKFLFWALCSSTLNDQYKVEAHGITRYGLGKDSIENSVIPVPSFREQQAITEFLDCKTAQIDTLIEKKQRQIDLLQEQRTALINNAVTKGLNPDVEMKDSGVEWLGEIPSYWDVNIKLTMLAEDTRNSFVNGPFGSNLLVSELTESGVPVIYIKDVRNGIYKRKSTEHVTPEKALELDSCRVDPGDILIAKVGDPPGATAVYPDGEPSGIVTQDVIRIKLKTSIVLPQYFALFLNSEAGRAVVGQVTIESTRSRIPLGDFKNVRIPLPPINEQIQIIEKLSELLSQADKAEKILYNLIERLQEYRTALISETVTGKIDVREYSQQ